MRVIAAVVLAFWSVALGICWHHCATGACSGAVNAKKTQPSCHAPSKDLDSEQSKPNNAGSSCFAKKPFAGEKQISSVATPRLHLVYLSAALDLVAFELPRGAEVARFRQTKPRDWVFTPEVSLGPAFRGHAPPVLL